MREESRMIGGWLALLLALTGAVAALAGLAALVGRAHPEIGAIAAVVAGALLIAVPWLPEAEVSEGPLTANPGPITLSPDRRRTVIGDPVHLPPPPLPGRPAARIDVEAHEREPNRTIAGANRARLGIAIEGDLPPGDIDWFAVEVPAGTRGRIVATLTTEAASVTMTLHDDAGQTLGTAATIGEVRVRVATLERMLDAPRYHVRLSPNGDVPARYQLTLAARR